MSGSAEGGVEPSGWVKDLDRLPLVRIIGRPDGYTWGVLGL
jgi:hypothetical protein